MCVTHIKRDMYSLCKIPIAHVIEGRTVHSFSAGHVSASLVMMVYTDWKQEIHEMHNQMVIATVVIAVVMMAVVVMVMA